MTEPEMAALFVNTWFVYFENWFRNEFYTDDRALLHHCLFRKLG